MDEKADDVSLHFLEEKPDIVHFSGYGSRANQIYLLDERGKTSVPVGAKVLSMLFRALRDNIRCVVLNACFSEVQALIISKYVDCVVGMTRAIGDGAAIKFAQGFYRGLGNGRDVKTAFDLGCFQIGTHFPDEHTTPQIMWKNDEPKEITFFPKPNELSELTEGFSVTITVLNNFILDPSSKNDRKAWKSFMKLIRLVEQVQSEYEIEDEYDELIKIRQTVARLRTKQKQDERSGLNVSKIIDTVQTNYHYLIKVIKKIQKSTSI